MLSNHGWTMLKAQPESSTTYCYVHPGDPDASDGDTNVHRTRIKLTNGILPSHIKVDVVPKKKNVTFDRIVKLAVTTLLISSYVLIALLYWELKTTKHELRTLEHIVRSLGKWETDEVGIERLPLVSEVIDRRADLPTPKPIDSKFDVPTTTQTAPSSTERGKREAEIVTNHGFPLLAHYKGGLPESTVTEGAGGFDADVGCPGLISPWFKDKTASGEFNLKNTTFREAKGSVVVPESGLYFIYAQVYYLTRNSSNSYSITVSDDLLRETILATCSSPPNELGESSCYTATARALKKDDRLQLRQRERNRHILLRQGQTFL
ncbi:unnamed protein product, partial [Nesidiocoris tenuis]